MQRFPSSLFLSQMTKRSGCTMVRGESFSFTSKGHKKRGMNHVVFDIIVDRSRKFHGNGLVFL